MIQKNPSPFSCVSHLAWYLLVQYVVVSGVLPMHYYYYSTALLFRVLQHVNNALLAMRLLLHC